LQNRKAEAGSIARVPAPEVESLVCDGVRKQLVAMGRTEPAAALADRELIERHVSRVIALRRILVGYATYYNEIRTHVSLGKDAPYTRLIERIGEVVAHPILGGLHHRYARI
jgi:hypothetical protein